MQVKTLPCKEETAFFLEIMDSASSVLKTIQPAAVMYEGALEHKTWVTCTSVKAPLMLNDIYIQTSFSGKALLISARQWQTTFCTKYKTMAL